VPADVCVIGGGFAGISLARLLTDHGLSCTVLERSARLGGKSRTIHVDGVPVELGTCYMSFDYRSVQRFAKRFGSQTRRLRKGMCELRYEDGTPVLRTARDVVRKSPIALRFILARSKLLARAQQRPRDPATDMELATPTATWCRDRGLADFVDFLHGTTEAYGYGPIEDVPVAYSLRYNTPWLVLSGALDHVCGFNDSGFGGAVEALAAGLDVWREASIDALRFEQATGCWKITASGRSTTAQHLVVACPLPALQVDAFNTPPWIAALLPHVQTNRYAAALVKADWFAEKRLHVSHPSTRCDRVLAARFDGTAGDGRGLYVCTLYPSSLGRERIASDVMRDVSRLGGRRAEVLEVAAHGDYFPRLSGDAIRSGALGLIEREQGRQNLWLTGSLVAHENWREIFAFNRRLAGFLARRCVTLPVSQPT